MRPNDLLKILSCLTIDSSNLQTDNLPIDLISMYIHNMYVNGSPLIRTELLKIILNLEINAKETILEKYNFDKLVSISIEQKNIDPTTKVDEEKAICFSISSVMLKIRSYLPKSMIRAFISLYYQPKHNYKTLILSHFLQVIDNYEEENDSIIYEISRILVENIAEGNLKFIPYVTYSAEHFRSNGSRKGDAISLTKLLEPIFSSQEVFNQPTQGLIKILRTWSGLFYYGIERHIVDDILLYLPSSPSKSIPIIKNLLKMEINNEKKITILDGYCGYLLSYLLKKGLIDKLLLCSQDRTTLTFLDEIIRFTGIKLDTNIAITASQTALQANDSKSFPSEHSVNKESQQMYSLLNIFSAPVVRKELGDFVQNDDPLLWDWKSIYMQLVRVLPFDEEVSMNAGARTFYTKLLDFFGNQFITLTEVQVLPLIKNCFIAFFDFLICLDYGFPIISSCDELKKMMLLSVHNVSNNPNVDKQSTIFFVFTMICKLAAMNEGVRLFTQWEITEVLNSMGTKVQTPAVAEMILPLLTFYPVSTISVSAYSRFLTSKVGEIRRLAIEELRKKEKNTPMFHVSGFLKLLVPHVKQLDAMLQNADESKKGEIEESLLLSLNLMCEFMQEDDHCLIDVAGDIQIHSILERRSHIIYSILLSREEALPLAHVDGEIEWWMKDGNLEYVSIFDKATECAFEDFFSPETRPEITSSKLDIPPHLFGQLSKAPTGQKKLSKYIPQLIEQCKASSNKKRRAAFFAIAHFASSAPEQLVDEFDLANVLIESAFTSKSLQLRGTLITCLSMFSRTKYFSDCLEKHNWQVIAFGARSAVIPIDPLIICVPPESNEEQEEVKEEKKDKEKAENEKIDAMKSNPYAPFILQLSDPITLHKGKADLISAYREQQNQLLTSETACVAMQLISDYSFSQDSRSFILGLFRSTPLVPITKITVDQEKLAECKVRIYEALQSGAPRGLEQVNWLKYKSASELRNHKFYKDFPELYIRDDMFEKTFKMSKTAFYSLPEEEKKAIRISSNK